MVSPITDPGVLNAIDLAEEQGQSVPLSTSVSEHLKQQMENSETIPVVRENPAMLPLAVAAVVIGLERAEQTGLPAETRFDLDTFVEALTDQNLSAQTRLDVADAIARVPGFDDSKEFSEYKQGLQFMTSFEHAAAMAKAYVEQAMRESESIDPQ